MFFLLDIDDGDGNVEFIDDCPPDLPLVGCKKDYCKISECPEYPNAECKLSLCGECKAVHFVDGKQVNCYPCMCFDFLIYFYLICFSYNSKQMIANIPKLYF